MAYTPNTWHSGDVVTSAKLNNIESGLNTAANVFEIILTSSNGGMTTTTTWAELEAAWIAGQKVRLCPSGSSLGYDVVAVNPTNTAVAFFFAGDGLIVTELAKDSADTDPLIVTQYMYDLTSLAG